MESRIVAWSGVEEQCAQVLCSRRRRAQSRQVNLTQSVLRVMQRVAAVPAGRAGRVRRPRLHSDVFSRGNIDGVEEVCHVDISKGPRSVLYPAETLDAEESKTTCGGGGDTAQVSAVTSTRGARARSRTYGSGEPDLRAWKEAESVLPP